MTQLGHPISDGAPQGAPTAVQPPVPLGAAPLLGEPGAPCTQCGAPLAADQRYCLNCGQRRGDARVDYQQLLGERLPGVAPTDVAAPSGAATRDAAGTVGGAAAAARTITPLHAAAGLGLLLLAVLVGSMLGRGGEQATPAPVVVGAPPTTPATTPATFTSDWTGEDGWTVQLQVMAKDGTTPDQVAQAKQAAGGQGAADVGALDSDAFASLDPGNYVIYSGVYASKADAKAALKGLKAGFPEARVIEVAASGGTDDSGGDASDGGSGSGDGGADSKALDGLKNATPDEYVEKSRKLPDEVGTGGEAPPEDDKAPDDGGNDSATIG